MDTLLLQGGKHNQYLFDVSPACLFTPAESCAMIGLKSAVKSLQDLEILYSYEGANLRMLGLSEQQDSRTTLEHYTSLLETALS